MKSRHTDWHDSLKCAVWSDITVKTATKLDTTSWKIPTHMKLADENFNIPGDIDLLLRADFFYEIPRSCRRNRPRFTVLQQTVLG